MKNPFFERPNLNSPYEYHQTLGAYRWEASQRGNDKNNPYSIASSFVDMDYNEESYFLRYVYFLGANDPYKSLKRSLKAEINEEAWGTLNSDTSRPFRKPSGGCIAVKVINHLGDEVMKVFKV